MSVQKEILLRYRSTGHARFEIPARLCDAGVAALLEKEFHAIEGIYRVEIHRRQRKLSIRYMETVCDFATLAKEMSRTLGRLDSEGKLRPRAATGSSRSSGDVRRLLKDFGPVRWSREKFREAKETAQAMGVLARMGKDRGNAIISDPEKFAFDFLNDVLVLYLIKVHWHLITNHWLPHPLRYRYAWLTVFYMTYLLMRSRMPRKQQ